MDFNMMNSSNIENASSNQFPKNIQDVLRMVGSRNPQEVFMEECKKRGVDPNTIISMVKNMR